MFELTLSISIDKQKSLANFQNKLIEDCGEILDIVVSHNENGRSYLALATKDVKREYLKAKVLEGIAEIIISQYKYVYFSQELQGCFDSVLYLPFLKAISIFDADCDFEVIKKEVVFSGEILIDSLFYFKLSGLKLRWEKTASILVKNSVLQSESAMIGIIRYLSDTSENFTLVANVKLGNKRISLKNYKGTKTYFFSNEGLSRFLTEIITLNPLKINLVKTTENEDHEKISKILNDIFGEKIYIQN